MRPTLALLAAAALLAGCAQSNGNPSPAPGSTTTTPTVTTPAAPASVAIQHDFTAAEETKTFDVPPSTGPYDVDVLFRAPGQSGPNACASASARIVVQDPAHQKYADVTATALSPTGNCGIGKQAKATTLAPGNWTVAFTGSGAVIGSVSVRPSA